MIWSGMEWSGIHRAVADCLNNHAAFWWHTPNEGKRALRQNKRTGAWYCAEGARLKQMGLRKGAPDFLILKNGILHGLEVKAEKKKPNDKQYEFGDAIRANGGKWDWADNIDTALVILRAWGIIPTRVSSSPHRCPPS
jgi:hypothetical protein